MRLHTGLFCYRVEMVTTCALRDTAKHGDEYLTVEEGVFYTLAPDIAAVANEWPTALRIDQQGIGHALGVKVIT